MFDQDHSSRIARPLAVAVLVSAIVATPLLPACAQPAPPKSTVEKTAASKPFNGRQASTKQPVKIAVHVSDNDPKVLNLALNNVRNVFEHYKASGRPITIEVVTYGPGLHMLRSDTSPVKDRVAEMMLAYPGLRFAACQNTRANMQKQEGKPIPLLAEAAETPSGVVRLVELQSDGYSYLRP